MWMIRAGRDSIYVEDFLDKNIVALSWSELGPLEASKSQKELIELYRQVYPDHSSAQAQASVNQILRFANELKIGDTAVTYDRDQRVYYLGAITSDVVWEPELLDDMPRVRRVSWAQQVPRDALKSATKNTLGAIQTLFKLNQQVASDLQANAVPINTESAVPVNAPLSKDTHIQEVQREQEITEELLERAETAIEERITRLDWESLQELVAGILRAMNYRTTVSPRGADRGVDIFASPDGLGLEEPRIFVEVKHRANTSIDAQQIRSFLGGRSVGDRCLYVSTGGFTKDARYEAERANIAIRLVALTDLRRLLVDYYDSLDEKTRNLVPLRRAYVPI
jgi:restriction system protein